MRWDAAAWLSEWDEAVASLRTPPRIPTKQEPTSSTAIPTRCKTLLSDVMSSTRDWCAHACHGRDAVGLGGGTATSSTRPIAAAINLLHLVQFNKTAVVHRDLCLHKQGAAMHYAAELPLTPTSSTDSVCGAARAANTATTSGIQSQQRRRIVFAFRDASFACGPDALHVLPQQGQPGHEVNVHSSARTLLQSDACHRLRWWRDAASASTTTDAAVPNHFTVHPPDVKSKSGVMEAWYLPAASWLRHGIERGFERIPTPPPPSGSPTANTMDGDAGTTSSGAIPGDDVVVVVFDPRAGALQQGVCQHRLLVVLEAAVDLAAQGADHDEGTAASTRLLVDVGPLEAEGTAWRQFQDAALVAAKEIAHCYRSCRVECAPTEQPSSLLAPQQPGAAPSTSTKATPKSVSGPLSTVVPGQRPDATRADDSRDDGDEEEDTLLWKRYAVRLLPSTTPSTKSGPSTFPSKTSTGQPASDVAVVKPKGNAPTTSHTSKRLLLSSAGDKVVVAPSNNNNATSAAAAAEHRSSPATSGPSTTAAAAADSPFAGAPAADSPFAGAPAAVLFVEVPSDAASIRQAAMSLALRRAIIDWYRPMMMGAVACGWHSASATERSVFRSAGCGPASESGPAPTPPLRAVIFLCHTTDTVRELLLSWCYASHDDFVKIPYLIAVSHHTDTVGGTPGRVASSSTAPSSVVLSAEACDALFNYVDARLSIDWAASLVLRGSCAMEQCCRRCPLPSKLQHLSSVEWVLDAPHAAATQQVVLPDMFHLQTGADEGKLQHLEMAELETLRWWVGRAACAAFGPFFEELRLKPRRPEVAVEVDRSRGAGMFIGIVRPPISADAVRPETRANMAPRSVRLSETQHMTIIETIRIVFSEEYRVAFDAMMMHQRLEKEAGHKPYLSGFCPWMTGSRQVRIASVVRGNLFAEVELNLDDADLQLLQQLKDSAQVLLAARTPPPLDSIEAMCKLLLPMARCNCTPRIGERHPRVLPGIRMKLCRHIVQLVFHFCRVYTTSELNTKWKTATHSNATTPADEGKDRKRKRTTRLMLASSSNNPPVAERRIEVVAPSAAVQPSKKEQTSVDFAALLQWGDGTAK